jgi:hypothetical protein
LTNVLADSDMWETLINKLCNLYKLITFKAKEIISCLIMKI